MKKYISIILKLSVCLVIIAVGCKQDFINGVKTAEQGKIYFLDAADSNGLLIPVLEKNYYTLDTEENMLNVSIPVFRGGFDPTTPFTVDVSVDNSAIAGLVASGDLPANTVELAPDDYTLAPEDTLSLDEGSMAMGYVVPEIKVDALEKYSGKVVALGLTLTGASKYSVNEEGNKVIFYLPVDSVVGKIYFEASQQQNESVISLLDDYTFDTITNTIICPVKINRGGFADLNNFTVEVSADDNVVTDLKNAGRLPSNTVILSSADYSLDNTVQMSLSGSIMQGVVSPEIKVSSLEQYSGKKAALGLTLTSASKFSINTEQDKVVVYFDVDSLLDDIIPPENLIVQSAWKVLNIANNSNVQISFNTDSSAITFTGGNNGHMAVYQAVQVKANKEYKIDMNVSGSGATDTWFEAYVNPAVPQQGKDYTEGKLISLNTWAGCGTSPFNGLLSKLNCSGDGNIISFPTSGTVYVLVKSGGANLGASGITISDVVFIRVQ